MAGFAVVVAAMIELVGLPILDAEVTVATFSRPVSGDRMARTTRAVQSLVDESPTDGGVTFRTRIIVVVCRRIDFVTTGAVDGVDVGKADISPIVYGVTERAVAGVVLGRLHIAVTIDASAHAVVVIRYVVP